MQKLRSPFSFFFSLLFLTSVSYSDQVKIMSEEGLFSKRFTVEVPTDSAGRPVDVVVSRQTDGKSSSLFFASGGAIPNRRPSPDPKSSEEIAQHPKLKFSDLQFIVDGSGQKIAAAYPLQQNRAILLTALHALQKAQFEDIKTNQIKRWGLKDQKTGQLFDLAIISAIDDAETLKTVLLMYVDSTESIALGYADHLNVVDTRGELMISRSEIKITSDNQHYVFFKNSDQAMIGYASSGAIIYNQKTGKAQSIVTCASNIPLNKGETTLRNRALKLSNLSRYSIVELNDEMINGFEKLPCEPQDSRGAGGP